MTTDLEKQFFDTFELTYESCTDNFWNPCKFECNECPHREEKYLQITSDILLELICIYLGYERMYMGIFKPSELRLHILYSLLDLYKETKDVNKKARLKQQVQALFKEER